MTQTKNASLEERLRQALRARIGEQRYQTWFVTTGARLVVNDGALTVQVEKNFYAEFLRSTFDSNLSQLSRDILHTDRAVVYQTSAPEPTSPGESRDAAVFAPQPAPTPKRGRGRPRKNTPASSAIPEPNALESSYWGERLDPSNPYLRNANATNNVFTPSFEGRGHTPSLVDAPSAEKRKRGRPRKYPAATQASPFSFSGSYNRTPDGRESARSVLELDDAERRSATLREFASPEARAIPSPAPRKRGRPKGSVKRVPLDPDASDVLRDARGHNVVRAPRDVKPRIKASDNFTRRFASLKTFVVGPSNSTAYKIVDLVVSSPTIMTPLYICGPTSVGKTHLLEGICDAFSRNPAFASKPPLYMTSEQFTTAFIRSLRGGSPFRDRFRNISLFALDELRFLEGKKSTQTELVYALDYLRNNGVQVVISGSCPLVEMTDLRDELVTRIQSGVYAEIAPPERETLAAILQRLALERNLVIPEDASRYVVSRFATHAREISGALNRLYAAHLATGSPITLDLARDALADLATVGRRGVRLEDVERVVQEAFGLESNALKSASRARKYSDPRAIAMWLARKHTRAALAEIGAFFGGRRHSAAVSAQKKVDGWLRENADVANADGSESPVAEVVKSLERALVAAR